MLVYGRTCSSFSFSVNRNKKIKKNRCTRVCQPPVYIHASVHCNRFVLDVSFVDLCFHRLRNIRPLDWKHFYGGYGKEKKK